MTNSKEDTQEKKIVEDKSEEVPCMVTSDTPSSSGSSSTLILVGCACFILGFMFAGFLNVDFMGGSDPVSSTIPGDPTTIPGSTGTTLPVQAGMNILIINDIRCPACVAGAESLIEQLETVFPGVSVETVDYSSTEGKAMYAETGVQYLPAILFDDAVKSSDGYAQVESYLEAKGDYFSLRIGANFDPTAEICDNQVDDNGDGKVDCKDPTCSSEWLCMEKLEKPTVEVFVMSHCPYGTQIEKGIIPVVELLGDKIDFEVKFCNYAMHGETEVNEELSQYCIQKEQNSKYLDYLTCFLNSSDSEACINAAGVDKDALATCISAADEEFKVSENLEDESKWLNGRFPVVNLNAEAVDKYGISGSPGLVINGVVASSGRDSASLLDAVCVGFKDEPAECSQEISAETPSPGFGYSTTSSTSTGSCG